MTTYNTGNPIGSYEARDLYDNAQNYDFAINSLTQAIWLDRFGVGRRTWYGLEVMVADAAAAYGIITLDGLSFTSGATVNLNEALLNTANNTYYKWTGSFPVGGKFVPPSSTPESTGGIGPGKWLSVGDTVLRNDLAATGGVNLVNGAVKKSGDEFEGHVDMPSLTIKSIFGNLIVGDQPVGVPGAQWSSPDSLRDAINVSRLLSNTPFNCHAFSDKTVLSQGTALDGYGAFDSTVIIYGSHHQEHAHSFQDRVSYRGSNRLDNTYGYYSAPNISGPGTIGDRRGVFVNDVSITGGGTLEQQTGVYLEHLGAANVNIGFQTRQATGYTFYAPNRATLFHNGPAGFGIDLTVVPADVPLAFRGNPGTAWYGFMTTDANGASYCVSSDVDIQFVQGGAVRAKIKPQANSLSAFTPGDDNHTPLGDIVNRWSAVYAGTGTIQTSDGTEKSSPINMAGDHIVGDVEVDRILDAWGEVSVVAFKWLKMIDIKGEDKARWHFGAIAQQVRDSFISFGIDGTKYGLLCFDKWDDQYVTHPAETKEHDAVYSKIVDSNGRKLLLKDAWTEIVKDEYRELVTPAGERWGLRPDQCAWLEAAYQRRRAERLESRSEKMELRLEKIEEILR